jgi:structure-specific recognition protein 1
VSASRTFDIAVSLKGGGEHQFSNINREEQKSLENFFQLKGIKTKNEMEEEGALMAAVLQDGDLDSSDDEVVAVRGSADEDDESVDEDFHTESESDVAEEYDSAHDSSGDSDEEMADAGGSDAEKKVEPPKKKAKTAK